MVYGHPRVAALPKRDSAPHCQVSNNTPAWQYMYQVYMFCPKCGFFPFSPPASTPQRNTSDSHTSHFEHRTRHFRSPPAPARTRSRTRERTRMEPAATEYRSNGTKTFYIPHPRGDTRYKRIARVLPPPPPPLSPNIPEYLSGKGDPLLCFARWLLPNGRRSPGASPCRRGAPRGSP